ncbi:hypothetical protein V6Z12_A05G152700 [Gossypium hirsutum]
MLGNRILKHGKKSLAYQIIYRALKKIQQKTETNPLSVLRQAIRGVTPDIAVKARRVGGSTHQVPIEIGFTQGKAFAIRWLLGASRKRPGRNMAFKLSSELVDAPPFPTDKIFKIHQLIPPFSVKGDTNDRISFPTISLCNGSNFSDIGTVI